jgi:hypothetical protein
MIHSASSSGRIRQQSADQLETFGRRSVEKIACRLTSLSQVVFIDGIPHATRAAIGQWLEYADPQKAIDNILSRNPHIESRGIPLNLRGMGDVRDYKTTVYHPIGFLLIVMESGQPKAAAMKEAVAEFVWKYAGGDQKIPPKEKLELTKLRRTLVNDIAKSRDAFARQVLIDDLQRISQRLDMPLPDIALIGKDPDQLALALKEAA